MTYQINPVSCLAQNTSIAAAFPATYRYIVMSAWFVLKAGRSGFQMLALNTVIVGGQDVNVGVGLLMQNSIGPGAELIVKLGDGIQYEGIEPVFGAVTFDTSALVANVQYHLLVSIDSFGGPIQAYINDAPLSVTSTFWESTTSLISQPVGIAAGPITIGAGNNFLGANPCIADAYWGVPSTFFDLTITANRRLFIDGSGHPVFLGANGELPLGASAALVFLTRGPTDPTSAFLINKGSAGGTFTTLHGFTGTCSVFPPTPVAVSTLAELYFAGTGSFVDLSETANRRAFISDLGGAARLGADGSIPTGVTPPVFLSAVTGNIGQFAENNGRGGAFTLTGTLVAGASDPPPATTSITTPNPGSPGRGMLGDYRTGNLYAFNPLNLTDNGTPRRWMRRWRAMPAASESAERFGLLQIGMMTGVGVPDGVAPHVSLRWSDDGGNTWSHERIMAVGPLGETNRTVKFNRLGATRRYKSSDRIFELTSDDPFLIAILGAEVDVA